MALPSVPSLIEVLLPIRAGRGTPAALIGPISAHVSGQSSRMVAAGMRTSSRSTTRYVRYSIAEALKNRKVFRRVTIG